MKFYLLLIILLLNGCTSNKKQAEFESSSEPVIARYGIEPELFWLDESGTSCEPLAEDVGYSAIYYEPVSHQYYSVINTEYITDVAYDTNNIQDEQNYYDFEKTSFPKLPLRYVGSIDLTNRVYVGTNHRLYLKKLTLLQDKEYYVFTNVYLLEENTLYPFVSNSMVEGYSQDNMIYYSNSTQIFDRVIPTGRLDFFEDIKSQ